MTMSPIDVRYGSTSGVSTAERSVVVVKGAGLRVEWSGDQDGLAEIFKDGTFLASFPLTSIGATASYEVEVLVPAIEKDREPTKVRRGLKLKRT